MKTSPHRNTSAIVDLKAIRNNIEKFKKHIHPNAEIWPAVKADAYGHGYKEVASFLKDIDYVEMFAVATLPEAIELRELGIDKGILILGAIPTSKKDIDLAIKYDISLTMVSVDYLKLLENLIDEGQTLKVHIKLDTGMHRIGLMSKDELSTLLELIDPNKFDVEGIFTHFATADGDDEAFEKQRGARRTAVAVFCCRDCLSPLLLVRPPCRTDCRCPISALYAGLLHQHLQEVSEDFFPCG